MNDTDKAVLHEVGEKPRWFDTLAAALAHVARHGITGYIVTPGPDRAVIDVRKGKRRSADGKRWVAAG